MAMPACAGLAPLRQEVPRLWRPRHTGWVVAEAKRARAAWLGAAIYRCELTTEYWQMGLLPILRQSTLQSPAMVSEP